MRSLIAISFVGVPLLLLSCSGDDGPPGTPGASGPQGLPGQSGTPGVSTGMLAGTVTNMLDGSAIGDAAVFVVPAGGNGDAAEELSTDDFGEYEVTLPVGVYDVTVTREHYIEHEASASILAGQTTSLDIELDPTTRVALMVSIDAEHLVPGDTFEVSASVTPYDGTTVAAYAWKQVSGVDVIFDDTSSASPSTTLASVSAFKDAIITDVEVLDRVGVRATNPHAIEEAAHVELSVTVTMSDGEKYTRTVTPEITLPFTPSNGLANVAIGRPVIINGKDRTSYDWALSFAGTGTSMAALRDANSRFPYFTPDLAGVYTLTEGNSGDTIIIYGEKYMGAISGLDDDGKPEAGGCTGCHENELDKFTDWKKSGHAEIFTVNYESGGHWGEGCLGCHAVGYDPDADNDGLDDASDYGEFAAQLEDHPPRSFADLVTTIAPDTAQLANIQCENCHGPNGRLNSGALHDDGLLNPERVSLSSDVCGVCHGEPLRHGRFQQWEMSRHADYELAIAESESESCARCHTAQGFVAWTKQKDRTADLSDLDALGLGADTAHPQTCPVCHEPHALGTTSGEPNDAVMRVSNDTGMLLAGFRALAVGNGAVCMMCHNSRRGLHNDDFAPDSDHQPHGNPAADVLMGENAYFVDTGERSSHSFVANTCSHCHMVRTPPPASYSYNGGGTNHTFTATAEICGDCHGPEYDGEGMQAMFAASLSEIEQAVLAGMARLFEYLFSAGGGQAIITTAYVFAEPGVEDEVDNLVLTALPDAMALGHTHGRGSLEFFYETPIEVHLEDAGTTAEVNEIVFQLRRINGSDGAGTPTGQVIPYDSDIVRVMWNIGMLGQDGSMGVHNPGFLFDVVSATLTRAEAWTASLCTDALASRCRGDVIESCASPTGTGWGEWVDGPDCAASLATCVEDGAGAFCQ